MKYQVTSTYNSGDILFLNSSRNHETDFIAVIFKDDEKYFQREGIDPVQDYDQRTIKVTGELQEYDGPKIVLYHSYQLKIIN